MLNRTSSPFYSNPHESRIIQSSKKKRKTPVAGEAEAGEAEAGEGGEVIVVVVTEGN